jgi:hypothetical protein
MAEYIEREAAKKAFCEYCDWAEAGSKYCQSCPDPVGRIPAADVVPVRHGRWLSMDSEKVIAMDDDGCPVDSCCCSECGDWLTGSDEYMVRGRYCPNCGARMDKDGDEG